MTVNANPGDLFFEIMVDGDANVQLRIFYYRGQNSKGIARFEPHSPEGEDKNFGTILERWNFTDAVQFALDRGAKPWTGEHEEKYCL